MRGGWEAYRERLEEALARYQLAAGERPDGAFLDPARREVQGAYRAFARAPFRVELRPAAGEELALRLGLKPALRLLTARSGWPALKANFESQGFTTAASVRMLSEGGVDGAVGEAAAAEGARVLACVGRDARVVEEALRVDEELMGHRCPGPRWRELTLRLGLLLGYPRCCVNAFAELGEQAHNLVPIRAAAGRSRAFHPWLDDLSLTVFHLMGWFPCRYDCPESLRLAGAVGDHLARARPGAFHSARRYLAMPRLYADDRRQIIFDGEALEGGRVRYRAVHTPYAFDRRTEEAAYEWIFFASVVAPLLEGDAATVEDDELAVERGGVVVRRVRRPPGSVWLPFRFPDAEATEGSPGGREPAGGASWPRPRASIRRLRRPAGHEGPPFGVGPGLAPTVDHNSWRGSRPEGGGSSRRWLDERDHGHQASGLEVAPKPPCRA